MSPQRASSSYQRQRKAADEPTIVSLLWPIVLGVLFTFLALRIGGMLALMGQEQFSVLYPWVALVKSPTVGISYGSATAIGQMLMYFQFPLYGFIGGAVLYMSNSVTRAFFTVFSVHLVALIIFIAISIFTGA
ncbi:MAG: hypothetical protein ACP5M4_04150 [Acidobacteriaceae bacterium]